MGLMLIQYVFNDLSAVEGARLTEEHTSLLSKQYGVSQKMIDTTLRTILFNQWDNKKERKRAEIIEAFEEAGTYFKAFNALKALELLQKVQVKMLNSDVKPRKTSRTKF